MKTEKKRIEGRGGEEEEGKGGDEGKKKEEDGKGTTKNPENFGDRREKYVFGVPRQHPKDRLRRCGGVD